MHLTWVSGAARPRSGRNVSDTLNVAARKAEVNVVECIESIASELQRDSFFDGEVLESRYIDIVEIRPPGVVTPAIADVIETRIGERTTECLGLIEDHSTIGTTRVAGCMGLECGRRAVDVAGCRARYLGAATVERQREGQAALDDYHRADLPAADQLVYEAVDVAEELLVPAEWQTVYAVHPLVQSDEYCCRCLSQPEYSMLRSCLPRLSHVDKRS